MKAKVPKIGKPRKIKELARKITEMRNQPLSKRIFEIVEEDYERRQKEKRVAKSLPDLEA